LNFSTLIFIDLGDNTSENNSFNPRTNFVLHGVIVHKYHYNLKRMLCILQLLCSIQKYNTELQQDMWLNSTLQVDCIAQG